MWEGLGFPALGPTVGALASPEAENPPYTSPLAQASPQKAAECRARM